MHIHNHRVNSGEQAVVMSANRAELGGLLKATIDVTREKTADEIINKFIERQQSINLILFVLTEVVRNIQTRSNDISELLVKYINISKDRSEVLKTLRVMDTTMTGMQGVDDYLHKDHPIINTSIKQMRYFYEHSGHDQDCERLYEWSVFLQKHLADYGEWRSSNQKTGCDKLSYTITAHYDELTRTELQKIKRRVESNVAFVNADQDALQKKAEQEISNINQAEKDFSSMVSAAKRAAVNLSSW